MCTSSVIWCSHGFFRPCFFSVCCQYDTERHDIDVVIHIGNFELSSWQTHLDNLTCEQSFWNRNCWGLIISHYSGEYLWTGHRNRCFWSILRHQKPFEVTAGGKRPTRPRVLGIFRVDSSGPWGMVTFVTSSLQLSICAVQPAFWP